MSWSLRLPLILFLLGIAGEHQVDSCRWVITVDKEYLQEVVEWKGVKMDNDKYGQNLTFTRSLRPRNCHVRDKNPLYQTKMWRGESFNIIISIMIRITYLSI